MWDAIQKRGERLNGQYSTALIGFSCSPSTLSVCVCISYLQSNYPYQPFSGNVLFHVAVNAATVDVRHVAKSAREHRCLVLIARAELVARHIVDGHGLIETIRKIRNSRTWSARRCGSDAHPMSANRAVFKNY